LHWIQWLQLIELNNNVDKQSFQLWTVSNLVCVRDSLNRSISFYFNCLSFFLTFQVYRNYSNWVSHRIQGSIRYLIKSDTSKYLNSASIIEFVVKLRFFAVTYYVLSSIQNMSFMILYRLNSWSDGQQFQQAQFIIAFTSLRIK